MTTPLQIQKPGAVQSVLEELGIDEQVPFELLNAVLPVIQFSRPDPSRQDRGAIGAATEGPTAGQNAHVQLFNPAGSGILVKPEAVLASIGVNGQVRITTHDTALTTNVAQKSWRDRRIPNIPTGQVRTVDNAGILGTVCVDVSVLANLAVEIPMSTDFVLDEGQGVVAVMVTVNQPLTGTWFWSEVRK